MAGKTGLGTLVKKGTVAIGNILSITGPSLTRDTVDTTVMDDNANGFREFITGLRDGGTMGFDMLFTKAGYEAMKTDFMDDDAIAYTIELPDADSTIIGFNGLVTDLPLDIPINDTIKCSVSIKITGAITVTS